MNYFQRANEPISKWLYGVFSFVFGKENNILLHIVSGWSLVCRSRRRTMEITTSQADRTYVMEIKGRLDSMTSVELEHKIKLALDGLPPALVLDFAAVEFLSSVGLRVLLSAAKRCRKQNTKLALHSLKSNIAEVFALGGLTAFLPAYGDRASAFTAVQQG
jgi:anti-sigma B factor antagonist